MSEMSTPWRAVEWSQILTIFVLRSKMGDDAGVCYNFYPSYPKLKVNKNHSFIFHQKSASFCGDPPETKILSGTFTFYWDNWKSASEMLRSLFFWMFFFFALMPNNCVSQTQKASIHGVNNSLVNQYPICLICKLNFLWQKLMQTYVGAE